MSVALALRESAARIVAALGLDSGSAAIEARALLASVLKADRAWLIAHSYDVVASESLSKFESLLERRLKGEPIAYILGAREFYGLDFRVSPDVLIPRPETELLVDLALARIPHNGSVLDLGTGSGVIAISIAKHRADARVTAVDRSSAALLLAMQNGTMHDLHNVRFIESDWFEHLYGERFDLIVSNPPYIAERDEHLEQGDLRFEPALALSSGPDGLDAIRGIIRNAPAYLEPWGWLLFEHGYDQGEICRELLAPEFDDVASFRDLSGIERVSGGRRLT